MKLSDFLKENGAYLDFIEKFDKYFEFEWQKHKDNAINFAFEWTDYNYWDNLHNKWQNIENKENDMLWLLDEKEEKSMKDNSFEVKEKNLYKHKDGGIYQVVDKALILHKETIVFYKHIDSDREYCRTISHFRESFTPHIEQWHENEKNYPCLCVVNDDIKVVKNKETFDTYNSDNDFTIRLANKEDFERYYYERD